MKTEKRNDLKEFTADGGRKRPTAKAKGEASRPESIVQNKLKVKTSNYHKIRGRPTRDEGTGGDILPRKKLNSGFS